MGTVISNKWGSQNNSPQIELKVSYSNTNETTSKVSYTLNYKAELPVTSSVSKEWKVVIGGVTRASGNFSIGGKTGTHLIQSGSFNVTRTTQTQSLQAYASMDIKITWNDVYKETITTSKDTITVNTIPSYSVSYNANGGSGAPSAQTKWHGTSLTLSSTKPTKSGYTFVCWNAKADGTGSINFNPGGTYTGNASITLYTQWQKTITLTYNANSGSGAPSSQSATVKNSTTSYTFTLSSTVPTRSGYDFLGWSTSSSGTATYQPSAKVTLSSNTTLYAVWKLKTYSVSYDVNSGVGSIATQTKTYGVNLTLSTVVPTRSGYKFGGWLDSQTGNIYQPGGIYSSNSNATLKAVWNVLTYVVKFDANGGSNAPTEQTKTHNVNLTLSTTVPTLLGYEFVGWATSPTNSPMYLSGATYTSNSDITLYAIWKQLNVAYIKVSGAFKQGDLFMKVNGNWEKAIPYVKINGEWRKGGI